MVELSYRLRRILYATITEYVSTGEPVGSRTLAKRHGLNLSPATIRTSLADLEEGGYLKQPHASAGRVPTDLGFRVFVDALVQVRELAQDERDIVIQRLNNLPPGSDVLHEAGELLSFMTGAAGVVAAPRQEAELLSQLRFISLRPNALLAVLVTRSGTVENRVVSVAAPLTGSELDHLNNIVAEQLVDAKSLVAVRDALASEILTVRTAADKLFAKEVIDAAVGSDAHPKLVIEGSGRLFDRPEFLDADKIRSYLRAFEDKERLLLLLEQTLASGGVRVVIGNEAGLGGVQDMSLVATSYGASPSSGMVGVIGPTRMDYATVVPLVDFTAKVMRKVLAGEPSEDDHDSG